MYTSRAFKVTKIMRVYIGKKYPNDAQIFSGIQIQFDFLLSSIDGSNDFEVINDVIIATTITTWAVIQRKISTSFLAFAT